MQLRAISGMTHRHHLLAILSLSADSSKATRNTPFASTWSRCIWYRRVAVRRSHRLPKRTGSLRSAENQICLLFYFVNPVSYLSCCATVSAKETICPQSKQGISLLLLYIYSFINSLEFFAADSRSSQAQPQTTQHAPDSQTPRCG
jgi:hypothetical protein